MKGSAKNMLEDSLCCKMSWHLLKTRHSSAERMVIPHRMITLGKHMYTVYIHIYQYTHTFLICSYIGMNTVFHQPALLWNQCSDALGNFLLLLLDHLLGNPLLVMPHRWVVFPSLLSITWGSNAATGLSSLHGYLESRLPPLPVSTRSSDFLDLQAQKNVSSGYFE